MARQLAYGSQNLWQWFMSGLDKASGAGLCLGTPSTVEFRTQNDIKWETFGAVAVNARAFAKGIMSMTGLTFGSKIALFLAGSPEFTICDLGCAYRGLVSVPIYSTFDDESIKYILEDSDSEVVICSSKTLARTAKIVVNIKESGPCKIRTVVVAKENIEEDIRPHVTSLTSLGIRLVSLASVLQTGYDVRPTEAYANSVFGHTGQDDILTLCYTSGTTGPPKGVILTHQNVVSELLCLRQHSQLPVIGQNDIHLSYLPVAHIMERIVLYFIMGSGARTVFTSPKDISTHISIVRPTVLVAVPRVLAKLRDGILARSKTGGWFRRLVFEHALSSKLSSLERHGTTSSWLWDSVVMSKVRAGLGGRLRVIICGSAALDKNLTAFIRVTSGAILQEGYGQTETCSAITLTRADDTMGGTAGRPLKCFNVRIDNSIYNENGVGEICIRGKPVFKGYYKQPLKTREAFTSDGWYRTGDLGRFDDRGRLVILDRIKSVFKLSQGEFVSPEKIEGVISKIQGIKTLLVTGKPSSDYLVCIVEMGDDNTNEVSEEALLLQVQETCRNAGLKGFEIPQKLIFSEFPDILFTPTMKVKRDIAKRHFADDIERMYS